MIRTRRNTWWAAGAAAILALVVTASPADAGQNRRGLAHWEGRRMTDTFNRHAATPVRKGTSGTPKQPRVWRKGDLTHVFNGTRRPPEVPRPQHNLNPPRPR